MEQESKIGKLEAFNIELSSKGDDQILEEDPTTAHIVGHDSWQQVGLLLTTCFNCGWILSFSNLTMVPLGWAWGIACLLVVGFFTAYANWLLAGFHFIQGQRFIRYRDIMGFLYGKSNRDRNYEVGGSTTGKVFNSLGAISAIIVSNSSGMILEIQGNFALLFFIRSRSTLREPAVKNMRKALYVQYSRGLFVYYGLIIAAYWAYGSKVSDYLPTDLSGPKWAKVLINSAVYLQSIVSQHMFVQPVHEALDTSFLKLDDGTNSKENIKRRFILRALFFTGNTFVSAAIPFIGDFINLLGSFALIPLTFIFPSMIFLKVKGRVAKAKHKVWHWAIIFVFSLLALATTISAVKLIVNNVRDYHLFADQ